MKKILLRKQSDAGVIRHIWFQTKIHRRFVRGFLCIRQNDFQRYYSDKKPSAERNLHDFRHLCQTLLDLGGNI